MKQTRREFIKTSSAAALAVGLGGMSMSSASAETTKRPNLIVIYCDDLGYGDLSCFGSKEIETPHLDALARDGVRLTNWYSNCPVCSPSRASLLTGLYPRHAGVTGILGGNRATHGLPADRVTIAKALKPLGYRTAHFGKWHLGLVEECRPNAHGFDEFFGFLAGCVDYYSHIFYWGMAGKQGNPTHDLWHNDQEVWDNGRYLTEVITEKSVEFIEKKHDEPFFLYTAFNAPHYPMHAPQKYLDRYPDLPWDKQIMAAMVSAVDDGVGEIVKSLKKSGQYENTMIFFSSDNGPSTESRNWLDGKEDFYYGGSAGIFRGHKNSLFDGGTRMPAILSWPGGVPAGQVCDKPGMMMDIFPTYLEAAGGKADHPIDGTSILPMVAKGAPSPHEDLHWEHDGQLAIRRGKWKLVLNGKLDFTQTQPDAVHLSDLNADPGERTNLAENEPALTADLKKTVEAWASALRA